MTTQSNACLILTGLFKNKEFAEFVNINFGQDAFRGEPIFVSVLSKLMIGQWYTPTMGMIAFPRYLFRD